MHVYWDGAAKERNDRRWEIGFSLLELETLIGTHVQLRVDTDDHIESYAQICVGMGEGIASHFPPFPRS